MLFKGGPWDSEKHPVPDPPPPYWKAPIPPEPFHIDWTGSQGIPDLPPIKIAVYKLVTLVDPKTKYRIRFYQYEEEP